MGDFFQSVAEKAGQALDWGVSKGAGVLHSGQKAIVDGYA